MVICLQRGVNDLHMVQLMPLPPHHLLLLSGAGLQCFDTVGWTAGRASGLQTNGGWWKWAPPSSDGVAPSRMVGVSASVNLPFHRKVQKFSSGTASPGWSRKKGHKTVVVWCGSGAGLPRLFWKKRLLNKCSSSLQYCAVSTNYTPGMRSTRTVLNHEDKKSWPWPQRSLVLMPWPLPQSFISNCYAQCF